MLRIVMLLLLLFSLPIIAQPNPNRKMNQGDASGTLTGILLEKQSLRAVEYGNVVLFRSKDSSMVTGSISAADGSFKIEQIPFGMYYLTASFIGYQTITIDSVLITPKQSAVALDTIFLPPSGVNMQAVVVTGEKEMMVYNLDKKIINVDKDLTSVGGTIVDVMQNIPSVTVDADGTISLRGNQNVTILMDGKPINLGGLTSGDYLSQIPSSSVESVELVTNPSARYDPEGTSGIINIVMKRKSQTGMNGIFSFNAGTGDRYNGSVNLNYKFDNFNIYGNYDNRFGSHNGDGTSYRTSTMNGVTNFYDQTSLNRNKMKNHSGEAGFDYYISDMATLFGALEYRIFSMDNYSENQNRFLDSAKTQYRSLKRENDGTRDAESFEYAFGYKQKFPTKGQELSIDGEYQTSNMDFTSNTLQASTLLGAQPVPTQLRSISANINKSFLLQGNYAQPLGETNRIEFGFKSTIKSLSMHSDYDNFNYTSTQWVPNALLKNYFAYDEQLHAVYLVYSDMLFGLKYQFGLRGEKLISESKSETTGEVNKNNYFALFPTLHLAYDLDELTELQLSYSRRIDRPGNRQLNPFIDYSDSLNIYAGNPLLEPQYTDSYELGFSSIFFAKTNLTASLFYKRTTGVMSMVSDLRDNGVVWTTWGNVAESRNYGMELVVTHPIVQWWRINGTFSYFKTEIDGGTQAAYLNTSDYSWNLRLNSNLTLWDNTMVQLIGQYNAPTVMPQSKRKEMYFVDLAVKKDFFEGKLTLIFRVSDIFNTRTFDSENFGQNFFQTSTRKMDSQVFVLGITYRLDATQKMNENDSRRPNDMEGGDEF